MKYLLFLLCVSISASEYTQGRNIYNQKACANCHGVQAEGSGTYPALANRSKKSLTKKLKDFQNGISNNQAGQIMFSFARGLSDKDINNVSIFLSTYKKDTSTKYEISDDILGSVD